MTDDATFTFQMNYGGGVAEPAFDFDLYPAALDRALNATEAREHWIACNAKGAQAQRALVEASNEWINTHPERDYQDRTAWIFARDLDVRPLFEIVTAATRESVAALTAYRDTQRANYGAKGARAAFRASWLDADARALAAWKVLDAAIEEREAMTKYVVQPERSTRIGHGHWLHSHALGIAKSPNAQYQRTAMREVVMVAPRVPVAQAVAADKASAK